MKHSGLVLWNAFDICGRNVQDLLVGGGTPYRRRFGGTFEVSVVPFGAMVEGHPISTADLSRLHQYGEKVLLGLH